jgi:DMSO/TMAO reductase YedYZ molybdopterin-dependent catalytic subunit
MEGKNASTLRTTVEQKKTPEISPRNSLGIAALSVGSIFFRQPFKGERTPSNPSRLPPNQREVTELIVFSIAATPMFVEKDWRLEILGEVQKPLSLTWSDFLRLPKTTQQSDFHCVTGWSKLDNLWGGTALKNIVEFCAPKSRARFVGFTCEDGYFTYLPLDVLLDADVMLAYELDGRQLEPEHGQPLRLVVPQKYGYKSAKWVHEIKFTTEDQLGFWEKLGYSTSADPWKEQRYK